jgi:hypothetical protein
LNEVCQLFVDVALTTNKRSKRQSLLQHPRALRHTNAVCSQSKRLIVETRENLCASVRFEVNLTDKPSGKN